MIAPHFAQRHIDRLNGIGGVDHLANVRRFGKERITCGKSSSPRLADRRVEGIPFFGKQFQVELGFRLGTGRIDRASGRLPPLSCA